MKNIVLTGFMGTGKTTVGQLLAERLNRPFIDTDQMIEERLGTKISEIFAKIGEIEFRKFESQTIKLISNFNNYVISCGGGAVVDPINVQNLSRNGIVINLYASVNNILSRIENLDSRPILKKMKNPLEDILKLLAKRQKAYNKCDFAVDTDNLTSEQVVKKILENKILKDILK